VILATELRSTKSIFRLCIKSQRNN